MKNFCPGRLSKYTGFVTVLSLLFSLEMSSQNAYFIDGYHGGIYGHYPDQYTQFLVDKVNKNPDWKINLEIEPETWDSVKVHDYDAYLAFKDLVLNAKTRDRIEFTNPAYGQGYLYNISGESIIRQFAFGIDRIIKHFPGVSFVTYAVEEPCFTSCLPQVLKSFGFKYAVLRCPNTCWGGYPGAFGGELINWIGPDGTKMVTVPRYACEALEDNSVWQTKSWNNSIEFINACFTYGIKNPVGMTYQDAGWKGGPWLGNAVKTYYKPSIYKAWTDYIENVSIKTPDKDLKFSQEDLHVSLVWGSQVLQKIAQQVRVSENKIIIAEKIASIAGVFNGFQWPKVFFDEGWRTLLLSQHHDCWIVPYNGKAGNTWADKVGKWTGATDRISDSIIQKSIFKLSEGTGNQGRFIRVFNTSGNKRNEIVKVTLPASWDSDNARVMDSRNREVLSQVITKAGTNIRELLLKADVPPMGYNTYQVLKAKSSEKKGAGVTILEDGSYKMETDLYRIVLDPSKGGIIKSLIAKTLDNKEFADQANIRSFNELRGNFFRDGGFFSSTQNPASVTILENGPASICVKLEGRIAIHKFTQLISISQGQRRIDFNIRIDWNGNPGIGDYYSQSVSWQQAERRKAFYNNQDKLLTLFPLNLKSQKVYVSAPFDVTQSKLSNTFFTRWDSIKNDIILNWVDITDAADSHGIALLSDHTTSYAHGYDCPLGLTLQYSGIGLWGRNYTITGPTIVNYSLIPHEGKWDKAGIWTEAANRNEPLFAVFTDSTPLPDKISKSLIGITGTGFEISSVTVAGNDLLVRLFNAEGDSRPGTISFDCKPVKVELVELNGNKVEELKMKTDKSRRTTINLSMPRFGIRTIKLFNVINYKEVD